MRQVDEQAVEAVLRMEDLIPEMREVMIDFSQGHIKQPPRRIIEVAPHGGFFGSMPASSAAVLGAKLVSFYPTNADRALPTHMAVIVLFRPDTGEPMLMMDGRLITKMRTAAVTAAYIDAVASAEVKSLAVLGAGIQGRSHIQALEHVRRFEDIRIWNRTPERAEQLAAAVGGRATSCEAAVRDAEVVVTATAASEPVFDGRWLRHGAKVASIGWSGADVGELDAVAMSHIVIVDSREGALSESGNVRRHHAQIFAELGEVLDGRRRPPPDATVIFESIGMACQDIAAADLVCRKLAA